MNNNKWLFYLICFCMIAGGFFAGFEVYNILSVRSATYGTVAFSKIETTTVFNHSFDEIISRLENTANPYIKQINEHYSAVIEFDGTRNDYEVLINGYPCYINEVNAGYIISNFSMSFYDIDGEVSGSVFINIRIEFLHSGTNLIIQITNNSNGLNYLNNLIETDGFEIVVCYSQIVLLKETDK